MPLNPLELFLQYARIDTQSRHTPQGETEQHPSSAGQTELAQMVFGQLRDAGVPEG